MGASGAVAELMQRLVHLRRVLARVAVFADRHSARFTVYLEVDLLTEHRNLLGRLNANPQTKIRNAPQ